MECPIYYLLLTCVVPDIDMDKVNYQLYQLTTRVKATLIRSVSDNINKCIEPVVGIRQ